MLQYLACWNTTYSVLNMRFISIVIQFNHAKQYIVICVLMCNLLRVDLVLDHQEAAHELDDSVRMKVREALLKRHHHQSDKKRNNLLPMVKSLTDSGRKQSEPHSMDKTGELNCTFYMCVFFFFSSSSFMNNSVNWISSFKSFFGGRNYFWWINGIISLGGVSSSKKCFTDYFTSCVVSLWVYYENEMVYSVCMLMIWDQRVDRAWLLSDSTISVSY